VPLAGGDEVGIGASLFLIAAGAILAWAVEFESSGVDLNTVGVILLVVGVIGLLLSLLFWSSFAPFRRTGERTVVRDREVL
jgi:hypothetical protein